MNAADFEGDGAMAKWVAQQTPAGRWAKPEEVANVTLFLAGAESDYMHATIIPSDAEFGCRCSSTSKISRYIYFRNYNIRRINA